MDFVILSLVMLAIGMYGLLTKPHLLKIFISIELIATAATLNFVMLGVNNLGVSQAFLILAFSTDTAVSAVILALLVIVSKKYGTSDISKIMLPEEIEQEEQENNEAEV
jgi:NADH:ubiquinone oxidoreductase subunit K